MTASGPVIARHASMRKRQHHHKTAVDTADPIQSVLSSLLNPITSPNPIAHTTAVPPPKAITPPPVITPTDAPSTIIPQTTSSIRSATPAISHTSSSSVIHPVSSTITTNAPTLSPANANASGASSTSSDSTGLAVGLSLTAIALCAFGIIFWLVRRRKLKEHADRRTSWNAGFQASVEGKRRTWLATDSRGSVPLMTEKASFETSIPFTPNTDKALPSPHAARGQFVAPPVPQPTIITPPPNIINNPVPVLPTLVNSQLADGGSPVDMVRVRRAFLPSLPDELPVAIGDMLQVLTAFDDGWSQCQNSRGDRGMVPLECLERTNASSKVGDEMARQEGQHDRARMSRRASSLYGGVIAPTGF